MGEACVELEKADFHLRRQLFSAEPTVAMQKLPFQRSSFRLKCRVYASQDAPLAEAELARLAATSRRRDNVTTKGRVGEPPI
jgi:hypothetical protein